MKLVLGSKSKGRRSVLDAAGYDYEVMSVDIDEKAIRFDDPKELVLALAHAKADALLSQINEPLLLITADQVAVSNGEIREKPEGEEEARAFLRSYKDFPLETVNGVVVVNTASGKRTGDVDVSRITFSDMPENVIDALIEAGRVMHCAGAIRVEDPLLKPFIDTFDGSFDSTSGLPLALLERLIKEAS